MEADPGPAQTNNKPIILIDPACVTPYAHNIQMLAAFREFFLKNEVAVDGVFVAGPSDYSTVLQAVFPFVYSPFFYPERPRLFHRAQRWLVNSLSGNYLLRLVRHGFIYPWMHQVCIALVHKALKKVVREESGADLFFPGADFYSLIALQRLIAQGALDNRLVVVRMLNVWENTGYCFRQAKVRIDTIKSLAAAKRCRVVFQTEVWAYARLLSKGIGRSVGISVIPSHLQRFAVDPGLERALEEHCQKYSISVGIFGRPRPDNGRELVSELIAAVNKKCDMRVAFVVQGPLEQTSGTNAALPNEAPENVIVLDQSLTDSQYYTAFDAVDVVLLPYDPVAYQMRGSGVYFDAICRSKPVLARRGTAFGADAAEFGFGFIFASAEEAAGILLKLAPADRDDKLLTSAKHAASEYVSKVNHDLLATFARPWHGSVDSSAQFSREDH
jgi:hypothetical protein